MGDIRQVLDDFSIPEDVDMVVGGPPCQGFSSANQHHKVIDDPRNLLYKYFIEAVTKFAPKFVVMENVRGMLKVADQVISDYNNIRVNVNGEEVHYIADYQLLNSQNFGVAQSRERLIYIAIRSDIAELFNITPASIYKDIESSTTDRFHALREALEFIRPLESPRIKGLTNVDDEATAKRLILMSTRAQTMNISLRLTADVPFLLYSTTRPGMLQTLIIRYLNVLNKEMMPQMKKLRI